MNIAFELKGHRVRPIRLLLSVMAGFSPIASLSGFAFGLADLPTLAIFVVLPAYLMLIYFSLSGGMVSKLIIGGWIAGVLAVGVYDLSRIPFMMMGWDDFIPKIGHWLTGSTETPGIIGYLWRYIGNGGGLGIAFACIYQISGNGKNQLIKWSIAFGVAVFFCLCATLKLSSAGEDMMFHLIPLTCVGSLLGHIVYGAVLGLVLSTVLFTRNKNDGDPG